MSEGNEVEQFCPKSKDEWRAWLTKNHATKKSVWVVYHKKSFRGLPSISWSEAVDEALCFGWIDSTKKTINKEQFTQLFTPRKEKSGWSKINKEKIKNLTQAGLLTPAGLATVARAKKDGSWSLFDAVETLVVPADLVVEFKKHAGAKEFFMSLSPSSRKAILQGLSSQNAQKQGKNGLPKSPPSRVKKSNQNSLDSTDERLKLIHFLLPYK